MSRKQYGGRAGGATDPSGREIYERACMRVRRGKSRGHVRPMANTAWRPSNYEPIPIERTLRFRVERDKVFAAACELAGIPPTARQYSKWVRGFGAARAVT